MRGTIEESVTVKRGSGGNLVYQQESFKINLYKTEPTAALLNAYYDLPCNISTAKQQL